MRRELDDFIRYCRVERRLAPLTCSAYERDVNACLRFLESERIGGWGQVRPPLLRRFLADEAGRRPAASSQARTVAALKCFFRFLLESEYIERNPAAVLRTPRKREALPDVLDRRELRRLLEAPVRDGAWERQHPGKPQRDRLLLPCSPTPACAAPSCWRSTGTTSTSTAACCASGTRRAGASAWSRSTPRSSR